MRIIKYVMPDNFNLVLMGDEHYGSSMYSSNAWEFAMNFIASEHNGVASNFVVDHGDIADCITSKDRRYYPPEHRMPVREQEEGVVRVREAMAEKWLTILDGNHPFVMWDMYGEHGGFTMKVCNRLEIPYGTTSCKIIYLDKGGNPFLKTYHQHGRRGVSSIADDPIRRWSNMKLTIKRHLKMMAGDCIIQAEGHTHKVITVKPQKDLYLVDDGDKIVQKYTHNPSSHPSGFIHYDHRWYANTGSFMKLYDEDATYSGYAERFAFDPVEMGFVVAYIRDRIVVDMKRVIYDGKS